MCVQRARFFTKRRAPQLDSMALRRDQSGHRGSSGSATGNSSTLSSLSVSECSALRTAVDNMCATTSLHFQLKARDQCSVIERYLYEDALRIARFLRPDECMELRP